MAKLTTLACATVLALVPAACATAQVEEPAFSIRAASGDFEVRTYEPVIVAETTVAGDAWGTRFAGFGPLADYIFAKERGGEKIAMTAPVTQSAPREEIAMTAPVSQKRAAGEAWTIAFTMPAGYTLATLPAPVNPGVRLTEIPARTMAVVKFTGLATGDDLKLAEKRLNAYVASAALKPRGKIEYAFYDPPWTLPFLRRNEAMIEVEDATAQ